MSFLSASRGNRFHSNWGGASYMGGVCSHTKGGGVNEVCGCGYGRCFLVMKMNLFVNVEGF